MWGRGTQEIVKLCVNAGHPEPEFIEDATSVCVKFMPSTYIAPQRVPHKLTERQRNLIQIIAVKHPISLQNIISLLPNPPAKSTVRDDLYHLKRLGLIKTSGHGRGAKWYLGEKFF